MHHTSCCSKWNRFSFVINKSDNINTYKYIYVNDPYVSYTKIHLPRSVDEWEIKYYSASDPEFVGPDPKYLKNAGVVNLISFFGKEISRGHWLELEISAGQYIWCPHGFPFSNVYHIPDVD